MSRSVALLGSAIWFVLAPGLFAGYVPWLITDWRVNTELPLVLTIAGAVLIAIGTAGLIDSFLRFALKGRGTPAPVAPPKHLVVTGLYRYVRNPMYVSVMLVVLGQILILGHVTLLEYGVITWLILHLFIVLYEEPQLRRVFGAEYEAYRAAVPRWIPRLRAWTQELTAQSEDVP